MKRIVALILSMLIVCSFFVSCDKDVDKTSDTENSEIISAESTSNEQQAQDVEEQTNSETPKTEDAEETQETPKEEENEQKSTPITEFQYKKNEAEDGIILTGLNSDSYEELYLPETIDNLPVVEISDNAFRNVKITNVYISKNIVKIGACAFELTKLSKAFFAEYSGWKAGESQIPESILKDNPTSSATYLKKTFNSSVWLRLG